MHLKIVIFIIVFSVLSKINSQTAKVNFIILESKVKNSNFYISYPVINSGDLLIDSTINQSFVNNLLQSSNTVEDEFIEMMDSFHSFEINHEITYNKNGILSILYSIYICSGNCDYTLLPLVYSLDNGKKLKINSILDTTSLYRNVIKKEINKQYQENINRIIIQDKECITCSESEHEFYNQYLIPKYKSCMSDFKLDEFCIYNNEITFLSDCFFSSAEKQYRPELDFSFSFEEIKPYLKVDL
ncbi:DUF4163 domain-containing protein [Flavobacteriales bacterium]|nr:DUF4163 domain-containing protein [Flavobacteriales bacterium]